jgi:hypothetical protein
MKWESECGMTFEWECEIGTRSKEREWDREERNSTCFSHDQNVLPFPELEAQPCA